MEYIFLIALGWFIQEFEPFKYFADWLYSKFKPNDLIEYVFGSFWSALAITWSFEKAVVSSFIVFGLQLLHEGWMRRK
jgi:hypothetical protein